MPKCKSCSKKGLFLRLTGGLCQKCLEKSRLKIVFTEAPTTSKTLTREEKDLLSQISKINAQGEVLPNELYQQLRAYEVNWLERNYDFNSLEGIERIPVSKSVPRPPAPNGGIKTHTGEVYYYLRHKASEHESAGNIDLAIACLKKSVAILKCIGFYNVEECYPLVKMLARAGYVEEAYKEKEDIDSQCIEVNALANKRPLINLRKSRGTDLVIMDAHGAVCSECAKYQGRVYSISGESKLFPKAPEFIVKGCGVHPGCNHICWPFIYGVNDDSLAYTLSVHPLQDKQYGADIVTFSNRPFVDDRTEECKKIAEEFHNKLKEEQEKKQRYYETMIETETKRGQEARDFKWIQEHLPDKCPKSISGYRRMKTQNTKNFQALKQAASELGYALT